MDNLSRADVSQRYKSGADLCLRISGVTAMYVAAVDSIVLKR
jgi:hypothetical protein